MVDLLYIVTFVPTILLSTLRSDDDSFDKLNYKYTVALLVLFAVITATKQFDDDRIECWNRANFIKPYIQYTNQICYISSTYYVDKNVTIPQNLKERKDNQLNYYQWTPFIILLMALFFHVPRLVWRALSVRSGIDLLDIVEAATDTSSVKEFDERDHLITYIVNTINMYVDDARRQQHSENRQRSLLRKLFQLICCMTGKFLGNYFVTLYLFLKLYYLINVIIQMVLLDVFLNISFLQFGYESVKLLRYGLNQPESKYFPRETFCDFQVREPLRGGQPLQRITVQCVLTVNLFNQQIFTVIWVWFVVLFILNIYSLFAWILRLGSYSRRFRYIYGRLKRTTRDEIPRFRAQFKYVKREQGTHVHEELVRIFIQEHLEADGYFFLRILSMNVSDFVVQEILEQLWSRYVLTYGEHYAQLAEKSYRGSPNFIGPPVTTVLPRARMANVVDQMSAAHDVTRKYAKQYSSLEPNVLRSNSAIEPIISSRQPQPQV